MQCEATYPQSGFGWVPDQETHSPKCVRDYMRILLCFNPCGSSSDVDKTSLDINALNEMVNSNI